MAALDRGRTRDGGYKKRAEKFGVRYTAFPREWVFERDGWICGLCDKPVDRHLAYPAPMSASLDHVIPLSRGGHHEPENVQCSHLTCNVRKGARVDARSTPQAVGA
ncbi:HNH endonuclease [Streptomyces sp. NPDC006655]|uniref:HNH endonuclease n=1 Tax=Streptomyces sp. NPDC006655 TaxID=3156898 RepID=UPI003454AEFA